MRYRPMMIPIPEESMNQGILKIKHYIFHVFPDQEPVRPFADIGGSVVVHFLRHAHHQAVINDLKVFHISSHSAVFQHFYSKEKRTRALLYASSLSCVVCHCLVVCCSSLLCRILCQLGTISLGTSGRFRIREQLYDLVIGGDGILGIVTLTVRVAQAQPGILVGLIVNDCLGQVLDSRRVISLR